MPYTKEGANLPDPIQEVMVAAKAAVGRFGGVLRRLLYSIPQLDAATIADAQPLTEQATQRVLSVKAGKKHLSFREYERHIRSLQDADAQPMTTAHSEEMSEFMDRTRKVWERLRGRAVPGDQHPIWLQWLRNSHQLADCLEKAEEHELRLPIDDVRLQPWFCNPQ